MILKSIIALLLLLSLTASYPAQQQSMPLADPIPKRPLITIEALSTDPDGLRFLLTQSEKYIVQLRDVITKQDKEIASLKEQLKKYEEH